MEKNQAPDKSGSFSRHGNKKNNNAGGAESNDGHNQDKSSDSDFSLAQVLEEVDRFIDALSSTDDKSNAHDLEVPNSVESLSTMVESMISRYDYRKNLAKFGQNQEDDCCFVEAVNRITKVINELGKFPSNPTTTASINRASTVLHRAMSFLDEEFRALLENSKRSDILDPKTPKPSKQSSFDTRQDSDRCALPETESSADEEFPAFSLEAICNMNRIATVMVSAGYEMECCMVYGVSRRSAFNGELNKLGFDNINIDDVQKMQWESLEGEISTWINVVKYCSTVLFSGERKLSNSVFSNHPQISERLFRDLAHAVALRLINFAEAVVLTKRSAEKLFKFLDMYETLRDLLPAIEEWYSGECAEELISETTLAKSRLGEAAVRIFGELENSIKSDNGKTPVPSGAVHPLTRYTMNYLKYAGEYKDTLEDVFEQNRKMEGSEDQSAGSDRETKIASENDEGTPKASPFSVQLMKVMDMLDANLDMKSKLYRDLALRYIFLMNNGRYILQKVRGSAEIHEMMGETWRRKRSADLRQYHKNYQRETWSRLLQCLSHEGLQVNGKVSKAVLKERFKIFNAMFEETHKTQSTWLVSDEQLQSELRVSISAVMIPAYRSFLGRFKQYLDSGRHAERYIKYQPEDIETLIDGFFDGNPTSMSRRR